MVREKLPYIQQKTAKTIGAQYNNQPNNPKPKRYHLRADRTSRVADSKQGKGSSMDEPGAGMRSVNETEYVVFFDALQPEGAISFPTYLSY